jgi:hypothetical protein
MTAQCAGLFCVMAVLDSPKQAATTGIHGTEYLISGMEYQPRIYDISY